MLKQRQERLLNNLLAVSTGKPKRKDISQKAVPKLIKEADDFLFELGGSSRTLAELRGRQRQPDG
jgi:hypothetical protein